ncbi:hypothetical protein [Akkermansia muciniphila]|uniref:hypothetical protein n=1 Tax=Akkermansia muciniphila TaxID=239935 RepID=UPI0012BB40E6|nr:hypothetical protein [Akkermansia muciniphila]QIA36137.1 hypothetical protein GXM23_06880 [Akkermansia muciniphila]BBP48551.1 hypothetical protein AKMU_12970 [Akkermansia muciniphila]
MLNFLGMTRHLSTTAGYAKRIGWLLFEDVTQSPFPVTGVSFTGVVKTEQGDLPVVIEHGEQEHCLELTFPALPVGRWPYAIHAQDESGEDLRLFSGYIGAVDSVAPVESSTVYDIPAMGITIPVEASKTIKAQWLSNTASIIAAQQAQQNANTSSTNAETASQAAKTATDAAATAAARAEEAEGYAGSAWASKSAAADSATAAGTSATNAARDAKSANDAKTDVESLAATWPETVSNGEKKIVDAGNEAVTAIQDKQADSVLAVGRASQTAQQNIAGARTDAVAAVQTAQERAVGAITPLVQRAETAKEAIDQAEGRINTAATNAATSATSAANSATEAQQALEAIPQVDASGNMTLAGGLTAAGAINANGGINIPLAVGAVTDTTAVNRFYTSGLAGAVSALVQPIYLNSSSITVAGSISKSSNGTLAGLTQRFSVGAASAGSNAYGSAVIPLIGPNGQFNYSSVCGFSLALNATAFAKFTFGIGRGSKTNRTGLTMDSYSMIPGNELAVNHGEIIDVTINTPYDTVRKGYEIRVREIFYVSSVGHWQVKTTTVFLPVGHNELMPNGLNRLIYMQSGPPSTAVREEKAALYMELGGGSTNTLFKIASLRGFIAFEAGTGVSTLIIDARNEKTYALSADAGTGTRHLYSNGLTNPTYHALEAMAVNAIEEEETADFEDINIPL